MYVGASAGITQKEEGHKLSLPFLHPLSCDACPDYYRAREKVQLLLYLVDIRVEHFSLTK